jgi:hypothetical protein
MRFATNRRSCWGTRRTHLRGPGRPLGDPWPTVTEATPTGGRSIEASVGRAAQTQVADITPLASSTSSTAPRPTRYGTNHVIAWWATNRRSHATEA